MPQTSPTRAANTYTLAVSEQILPLNEFMENHPYLNPENLQSAILCRRNSGRQILRHPHDDRCTPFTSARICWRRPHFDPANQLPHGTREELIEYAQTLTKDKDGDGTIDQWGYGFMADNTLHTPHMWLAHVWAGGGDLVDEEGRAIYDSEAIAAAQFYYDLVNTYEVSPPEVHRHRH